MPTIVAQLQPPEKQKRKAKSQRQYHVKDKNLDQKD